MQPAEKITELRKLMAEHGLSAWIVPSADPHQSEYVADCWKARAWLSGFRGSAGSLVVTDQRAGLWTDPRYHIRAAQELAGSGIELFKSGLPSVPSLMEWLRQELPSGAEVGFDGRVMSCTEAAALDASLSQKGIQTSHAYDLVGELWHDRPSLPLKPVFLFDEAFAGESRVSKLTRIRAEMQQLGASCHLLCALDDIAWMLNIRGSDIDYNPVAVSFALVSLTDVKLFIQPVKVPDNVKTALEVDGVVLLAYAAVEECLAQLPTGTCILIDPEKTNVKLRGLIPPVCQVLEGQSLPYRMKTIKNPVELAGLRRMNVRDGAALVRWLCWLDGQVATEAYTEVSAADKLLGFRRQNEYFQGLSFGTIAGYGPNSAVGHYQSDPLNVPTLRLNGIFLIDSGGQYLDGTSDITRTITLGNPTQAEKQAFTQVLRCHIRLATARFPQGTQGLQLDAVAREPLWRMGWNCRHGIGHGVGHFLNVHENPPRFNETNTTPLQAGMQLSNEPGVYFEGRFGVRIENLLVVVPAGRSEFAEFLAFETVSLCPIDLDLVDPAQLEAAEIEWLNAYHRRVWEALSPLLSDEECAWLRRETRQI